MTHSLTRPRLVDFISARCSPCSSTTPPPNPPPPLRSSPSLSAFVLADSQVRRTFNPMHIESATSPPKPTVVRSASSRPIQPLPSIVVNLTLPASQLNSAVAELAATSYSELTGLETRYH
ncbi:hypothetical protein R3P38DRAFT_3257565 [Favolaschia claudopus]|uniref:Uncharacterized protein n=1 Tax=Favolaschia claudopus TaxID=2862362 RepID=A0AAW0DDF8_9AGAR